MVEKSYSPYLNVIWFKIMDIVTIMSHHFDIILIEIKKQSKRDYMSTATRDNIAGLYVATFNRAPDAAGLNYWVNAGMSIENIAQSFFDQPETQALYPTGTTTTAFVTSVYQNLFNRAPDQAGLDYWVHDLDTHTVSNQNFILAVTNGALAADATILENKKTVGLTFADNDLSDITLARTVMENVDETTASVNSAEAVVTRTSISGATVYIVQDDTGDRVLDNLITTMVFHTDGTITETDSMGATQGTWSVDNANTIVITDAGGTWYMRDSGISVGDGSVVYSEDVYSRFATNGFYTAEVVTDTLADAQSLVGVHIPATNIFHA